MYYFNLRIFSVYCVPVIILGGFSGLRHNCKNFVILGALGRGRGGWPLFQGERWYWTVDYTCTQSLIDMLFFVGLKTLDTFTKTWLVNSVQIIVNYRSSNFVCHHWACTSIYRPLSYPLLSLLLFSFRAWWFRGLNFCECW